MRYEIIICLFAVVVLLIIFRLWKIRIVTLGYWFCKCVSDLSKILTKISNIKNDENICNIEQAIFGDSIMILYNPKDMKTLFYQLEEVIYKIEILYNEIKDKEYCFRSDDWEKIQKTHKTFVECVGSVRYQEWRHGYHKLV